MKLYNFLFIIFVNYGYCQRSFLQHFNVDNNNNNRANVTTYQRTGRRSNIMNTCTTQDNTSGMCMTRFNCLRVGGTVRGFCSLYGGVCCETNIQCSRVTNAKKTIIKNPTQFVDTSCKYIFKPYSLNVCQLLIEFEKFELKQPIIDPNGMGVICEDYLQIENMLLCGENNQQHLYFPFNVVTGNEQMELNFYLPSGSQPTTWSLIVTQLECPVVKKSLNSVLNPFMSTAALNIKDIRTIFATHNSDLDLLAPPGCRQYYTERMGTIKSFNYNNGIGTYMPNLSYAICIKAIPGTTMIEYTLRKFALSTQIIGQNFDVACHSTIVTVGHREDYLTIPQSIFDAVTQPTHYCGEITPGKILFATPPYIMYFNSDDMSDSMEIGFNIGYNVKTIL